MIEFFNACNSNHLITRLGSLTAAGHFVGYNGKYLSLIFFYFLPYNFQLFFSMLVLLRRTFFLTTFYGLHNTYNKLPTGPLRAASMYCFHLLSYDFVGTPHASVSIYSLKIDELSCLDCNSSKTINNC